MPTWSRSPAQSPSGAVPDVRRAADMTTGEPLPLIRLRALPAPDVWHARNTVTLYAVEPRSVVTVTLIAAALKRGDVAGLALFERPYAWLGVECMGGNLRLVHFDERSRTMRRVPLGTLRVWLRA